MNIADLIGPVDAYSMMVALGIGGAATVISVTAMTRKTRTALKLAHDFDMQKLRYENDQVKHRQDLDQEKHMAELTSRREIEFRRIEHGMVDVKVAQ